VFVRVCVRLCECFLLKKQKRMSQRSVKNDNEGEEIDWLTYQPVPKKPDPKSYHSSKLLDIVCSFIRGIALWSYILTTIWLLWMCVPLRVFHPFLRKIGCPSNLLPIDLACLCWARFAIWLGGIDVRVVGFENVKAPTIILSNHQSALDGFLLGVYIPNNIPRAVMKREMLYLLPPVFGVTWLFGHIYIDRNNRETAIAKLNESAKKVQKNRRVILLFPEGTRTRDGKIAQFKKGPFIFPVIVV